MLPNDFNPKSREELQKALYQSYCAIDSLVTGTDEPQFQHRPQGRKWSIAENIYHLMLATRGVAKALGRPKSFFEQFGVPEQPTRSYQALSQQYFQHIRGRQASEATFPIAEKPLTKQQLLDSWQEISDQLEENLAKWSEEELDQLVLPHPAFGNLTMREMLFFVIYHNYHHLESMQHSLSGAQRPA